MPTDVVWKIGDKNKWGNKEELRYSIRSIVKNFKDLRNIVIVGTLPNWIQNVKHIPFSDDYSSKDINIIRKLLAVCDDAEVSDNFVNISDDQLIIYPIGTSLLKAYTINSDIRRIPSSKFKNEYARRITSTLETLKKEGLPINLYEGHIPYLLNKIKYKQILSKYDFAKGNGLCGNTLYFNNFLNIGEQPVENVRAFIKLNCPTSQLIAKSRGKLFFGYQKRALSKTLKEYLKNKFPEKTIYEK